MKKQAGLLFPISVLPGRYGVGDFGQHAYELVDKMASASITLWQILPLNPLGYGLLGSESTEGSESFSRLCVPCVACR